MRQLPTDVRPLVVSRQSRVLTPVQLRLQFRQRHVARHLLLDLLLPQTTISTLCEQFQHASGLYIQGDSK